MSNIFAVNLLGTDYADHTVLVTVFSILVIIAMLFFRKFMIQVFTGSQNKKR
jgi:hypothetical protein